MRIVILMSVALAAPPGRLQELDYRLEADRHIDFA